MLAACALACGCGSTTPTPERSTMTATAPAAAGLATTARKLEIDLLYLDLTTCGRCVGTNHNLEAAIADVSSLLGGAGVEVSLRKVHVDTAQLAREHRFVSSPTIRVNGQDVALELRESSCDDCAEIGGCGGGVDCRVWVWQGREHTVAPRAMVVDALLRAAYGPAQPASAPARPHELPENLARFYAATAARTPEPCCTDPASCCTAEAPKDATTTSCCAAPESCCVPATMTPRR